MKTKFTSKNGYVHTFFCLLFLLLSFSLTGQCPTINDPNPPPICNAAGLTYDDLTIILVGNGSITENGATVRWYESLTGGTAFASNELVKVGALFMDNDDVLVDCSPRQLINITFAVSPNNTEFDEFYCSDENPTVQTFIDDALLAFIPSGGSVTVYNDFNTNDIAAPTQAITSSVGFEIVFTDAGGCTSQVEGGFVIHFNKPNPPNINSPQRFCDSGGLTFTIADLDVGGATNIEWYSSSDANEPQLPSTTVINNGDTLFALVSTFPFPCDSETTQVEVIIDTPFNPGVSSSRPFCEDNISTPQFEDLFPLIGGTPDTNGTWTGPIATTNGNTGTIDISQLPIGDSIFTYTVPTNNECPEDSATVTISIRPSLESGIPSTSNPISFCESGLPANFDLFTLLTGHDTGGQWTQGTSSTDPVVTSTIDLTTGAFTPGNYDFTYTQNILPNPCPEESTTVRVIVLQDPNAGVAINQTFCENDLVTNSPFNLFTALDGSQDNNLGTWTDATNATIADPVNFDITGLTLAGSPYILTYTIDNGVCTDAEQISITVEEAPESGTPISDFPAFCQGAAPNSFDLFTLIEGESGTSGTWINNTTSTPVTDPMNVDLSILAPATYNFTFTIDLLGTCDDDPVMVEVTINALPNTGTADPAVYCENDAALSNTNFDLFTLLTGTVDTGGQWYEGTDTTGTMISNILDLNTLTDVRVYNYTHGITDANGCTSSTTTSITIEEAPESGTANDPVVFCISEITTGQTYDLFDLLTGEDPGGTWSDDDASLTLSGNIVALDDLGAIGSGTYDFTYSVMQIGNCGDLDITVSIIMNDTPPPTVASVQQDFCDSATIADLQVTGTSVQWYDAPTGGNLLLTTDTLIDNITYYATQTNTGGSGCESSMRTAVLVRVHTTPNSGALASTPISTCNNTTIDLNLGLDGSQDGSGTWYEGADTTGTVVANPTAFDVNGAIPGDYEFTYEVTASAPCVDSRTTITVTIESPLNTGTPILGNVELCSTASDFDLFSNLSGNDPDGTWEFDGNIISNIITPSTAQSGIYTYILSNECGMSNVSFDVTIIPAANAGNDINFTICSGDIDATNQVLDLFDQLDGTTDITGTFTTSDITGFTGNTVDLTALTANTLYTFTYTIIAVSPCTIDDTAQITVRVNETPAVTVVNATPEFCLIDVSTVADLVASVNATGTINWYSDAALTTQLNITDALSTASYYVTQTDTTTNCESVAEQIDVTVNDAPIPTLISTNQELCINDDPTIAELTSNINESNSTEYTLVWYDSETGGATISSNTILSNGATYYAALVSIATGCESSVRLAVTPDLTSCGQLMLPDGFSPNGDGVNDTYEVDNLAILYPNFELEIFNRNGNIVYKGNANTPRFNGISNQGRVVAKGDLPVGVYFYIFKFNDGVNKPEQGRLYLSR